MTIEKLLEQRRLALKEHCFYLAWAISQNIIVKMRSMRNQINERIKIELV